MDEIKNSSYYFPLNLRDNRYWDPSPMIGFFDWHKTLDTLENLLREMTFSTGNYVERELLQDVARYGFEDSYHGLLGIALSRSETQRELLQEFYETGRFPRGRYADKYWLYARVEGALHKCLVIRKAADQLQSECGTTLVASQDNQEATEWLLWKYWEERGADIWIQKNIDCFLYYTNESLAGDPVVLTEEAYDIEIRRVKLGYYRRCGFLG